MATNGSSPAPNQQVLSGTSQVPPALAGYPFLGTMAAWCDSQGKIWLARDKSRPPYQAEMLNPNWTTFEPPALAISLEWETIYLAWTDPQGSVHVASSADGWNTDQVVASSPVGPALLPMPGQMFLGFNNGANRLQFVSFDRTFSSIPGFGTGLPISSRPTLTAASGRFYALAGGAANGQGDQTMRIYATAGDWMKAEPVPTQATRTFGPPSMAVVNGNFHLVWADGETLRLCHAATTNLNQFAVTRYSDGCHFGGPALVGMPDGLTIGWSYGAPPENPNTHHITLAHVPLQGGDAELQQIENALVSGNRRRVATQQCGPFDIYDPAANRCVPKGGCWGGCVLESMDILGELPIFNFVTYGLCVAKCKSDEDDEGSDKRRSA